MKKGGWLWLVFAAGVLVWYFTRAKAHPFFALTDPVVITADPEA